MLILPGFSPLVLKHLMLSAIHETKAAWLFSLQANIHAKAWWCPWQLNRLSGGFIDRRSYHLTYLIQPYKLLSFQSVVQALCALPSVSHSNALSITVTVFSRLFPIVSNYTTCSLPQVNNEAQLSLSWITCSLVVSDEMMRLSYVTSNSTGKLGFPDPSPSLAVAGQWHNLHGLGGNTVQQKLVSTSKPPSCMWKKWQAPIFYKCLWLHNFSS